MSRGWHIEGERQVVDDLAACDDSDLDFALPIDVRGVPADAQVSCRNTRSLLQYLEKKCGVDPAPLLEEVGLTVPLEHLRDPHKWVSYPDSLKVFEMVRRQLPSRNPRHFLEIGSWAHLHQSMGAGVDALSNILPLRRVYWLAAEYNRMFNNGQFVRSVRLERSALTVDWTYASYVQPYALVDMDFWALGIYLGFPERRGQPRAEGVLHYTQFPIERLLAREYAWLGVTDHGFRRDETFEGVPRRIWQIEGVEHAREVLLLREGVAKGARSTSATTFAPHPVEFEEIGAEEAGRLLELRLARRAFRVVRTFERRGECVVRAGEIWNAPCTRVRVSFTDRPFLRRLFELVVGWSRRSQESRTALALEIRAAKVEAMQATRERLASERKSEIFQTYARRSLVERIDRGEDPRLDKPVRRSLAVLFSDLRNFTGLAARMGPEDTVAFLNSYFNRLNRPIYRHRGEIDKIMGDGLMAAFGDQPGAEPSALRAARSAIDIRREVQALNRQRWTWHREHAAGERFLRVDNGVGITCGPVVVGNIGSADKLDHTLIGDVVNVSSRIEALTRRYGSGILVSGEVREHLGDRFQIRLLDRAPVRGRSEPVQIWEIFDHEPEGVREVKIRLLPRMDEARELRFAGRHAEAGRLYRELRAAAGPHRLAADCCLDPALDFFIRQCALLAARAQGAPSLRRRRRSTAAALALPDPSDFAFPEN